MKATYDFSNAVRNPYAKREKRAVTIRLEKDIVDYFKAMSVETGVPYQNLMQPAFERLHRAEQEAQPDLGSSAEESLTARHKIIRKLFHK